jgi:hypothetical protein
MYVSGAGKTYTFFGPDGSLERLLLPRGPETTGAIPNSRFFDVATYDTPTETGMAMRSVLEALRAKQKFENSAGVSLSVSLQFIEIYEEKIMDLLSDTYLTVRRDTGDLVGVSEVEVEDVSQATEVILTGHVRKKFAATDMNHHSSRSHTALILKVIGWKLKDMKYIYHYQYTFINFYYIFVVYSAAESLSLFHRQRHEATAASSVGVEVIFAGSGGV